MSDQSVWELMFAGAAQGVGLIVVVWLAQQVRKFIYYRRRWKFYTRLEKVGLPDALGLGEHIGPDATDPWHWQPVERYMTGGVPSWAYALRPGEKQSQWPWIRASFRFAARYQQWKPEEHLILGG